VTRISNQNHRERNAVEFRRVADAVVALGVDQIDRRLLLAMWMGGATGLSQSELAQLAGAPRPTVARRIGRLERQGYFSRKLLPGKGGTVFSVDLGRIGLAKDIGT